MLKEHTKKEEIERIVQLIRKYRQKDYSFTNHYWTRLAQRDVDHEFVLQTFPNYEKIRLIEEENLPRGDIGFDLHYELSDHRTLIIGVIPVKKLVFTHIILRERRWQSAVNLNKPRR